MGLSLYLGFWGIIFGIFRIIFGSIFIFHQHWDTLYNAPPKFNSSPLKNCGWVTSFLLGPGNFSGAMLVLGRVIVGCKLVFRMMSLAFFTSKHVVDHVAYDMLVTFW